jgi:hypothetical protein
MQLSKISERRQYRQRTGSGLPTEQWSTAKYNW